MVSEISWLEKDKHSMFSLIMVSKKTKQNKPHRNREQIGGCYKPQVGDTGEGGQKVQTYSYKINKSQACNVQQ